MSSPVCVHNTCVLYCAVCLQYLLSVIFCALIHTQLFYHHFVHREGINKRQYETVEAVVADIVQMYENCILYNDETSLLGHEAIRQRKEFQKLCKKRRLVE